MTLKYALPLLAMTWCQPALAQASAGRGSSAPASRHLRSVIAEPPYYALDWHELKLVAGDPSTVLRLKDALRRSRRTPADASEQSLWIDAAAGHPEGALAFYDANARNTPSDKTLLNAACWARAAHGLDREHVLAICDAAVNADPKSYSFLNRGKARLQLGLNELAIRDFEAVLGDRSTRPRQTVTDAAFGRGLARTRLGDAGGNDDMRLAAQADPQVRVRYADLEVTSSR